MNSNTRFSVLPLRRDVIIFFGLLFAAVSAMKEIRFASPLQSLTIPDPELLDKVSAPSKAKDGEAPQQGVLKTHRRNFLPRFLIGLKAESTGREQIALGLVKTDESGEDDAFDAGGEDWVGNTKSAEERRRRREDAIVEKFHDAAMVKYDAAAMNSNIKSNSNKYQFVGLVDKANKKKPISWHARPKPQNAKWSVRLLHVNKDAIVKDLFDQGKIDIFAKYTNTGKTEEVVEKDKTITQTNIPIVTTKYEARQRSWKNLYNFSPKHLITDSSGAYWRERRLRPGMYTDGSTVYESSYRYRDGRNGMHRVSTLTQFLSSSAVDSKDKGRILKKLKEAAPDVVLEL